MCCVALLLKCIRNVLALMGTVGVAVVIPTQTNTTNSRCDCLMLAIVFCYANLVGT